MDGGPGSDTLTGGSGNDKFIIHDPNLVFAVDSITDFSTRSDKIQLVASDFGLTVGALATGDFVRGTGATAAHGQFLYNATSKTLLWDADGTGSQAPAALVTFTSSGTLNLQASNLVLI